MQNWSSSRNENEGWKMKVNCTREGEVDLEKDMSASLDAFKLPIAEASTPTFDSPDITRYDSDATAGVKSEMSISLSRPGTGSETLCDPHYYSSYSHSYAGDSNQLNHGAGGDGL
jgi:hypothetical protein